MNYKYRIVKNGLEQFFVEKLVHEDIGVVCADALKIASSPLFPSYIAAKLKGEWVRCEHGDIKNLELAKRILNHIKELEISIALGNQIEVVYEEGV